MKRVFIIAAIFAFLLAPTSFVQAKKPTPTPSIQINNNTELLYCTRGPNGTLSAASWVDDKIEEFLKKIPEYAAKAKNSLCGSNTTPSSITISVGIGLAGSATWQKSEVCNDDACHCSKKEGQKK